MMVEKSEPPGPPDIQLLRSMLHELQAYLAGRIDFAQLVADLDIGIGGLSCEASFVQGLRDQWWVLEQLNALALDQGRLGPLEEHASVAADALRTLEAAISGQLAVVPPEEE